MRGVLATDGNLIVADFGGTAPPNLTKKRLAMAIGRSTRYVELRVNEGMPSSLDSKGRRRFSLSECRSWLETQQKGAANG